MAKALNSNVKKFINRAYYGTDDVDILAAAINLNQNILLTGPAGTGKTSLARVVAEDVLGRRFTYIPCHTGATAEALIGQFIPDPSGKGYKWMDGVLTSAVRNGYVVLLDEVNSLLPEVAFIIHGLLDDRREIVLTDKPGPDGGPEVVQAHENFGLIAAGNPDYEGVRTMNEAFTDRFACRLHMGYVWEVDMEVLASTNHWDSFDQYQRKAIEAFVKKIREASRNGGPIISDISTRAFVDFVKNITYHGFPLARTMFLARVQDPDEQQALRVCFRECWDDVGDANNAPSGKGRAPAKQAIPRQPKGKGRAGRFAAPKVGSETAAAASETF